MAAAGPLSVCYSGCGVAWTACYAAAGLVAGTVVASPAAPAAALACNAAEGLCMTGCTTIALGAETSSGGLGAPAVITVAAAAFLAMYKKWRGPKSPL
eukprot:m.289531 g.289531  ORF g.289531 m.289531 type:complete len:98 (+) comp16227_c3_seq2:127-420(+)